MILGSGPEPYGQGIEFDHLCARFAGAAPLGYETVATLTVSTDYDISTSPVIFEPLTLRTAFETVVGASNLGGLMGVFVQWGGQTPLKLARAPEGCGRADSGTTLS